MDRRTTIAAERLNSGEAGGRRRVTVRRRVNGHAWYQLCGDSHNLSRILRSYWEPVKTPDLTPRDVPF